MTTKLDTEVDTLLLKLYTISETVGFDKEKGLNEIKKKKRGKGDRFEEVKGDMVSRLGNIKELMTAAADVEKQSTSNPKEIIERQAEIRESIRQLSENWRELDGIYRVEARKKRSKFSPEELERQKTIVIQLQEEITKVKEIQRSGYTKGNPNNSMGGIGAGSVAIVTMDESTLFTGGKYNETNSSILGGEDTEVSVGGVEMTASQQEKIQSIKARDQEFDKQIEEIGRGILDLQDYAISQNEEVKRQNVMLDSLENKITNVHDHVYNVNSKMKETLDTLGRKSDKFCVDLICLIMTIGFAAVLYSIWKANKD